MGTTLILAILGFVAGAGITYLLMQKKLDLQKQFHLQESRVLREELERAHESRMQATIKSLQADYQNELAKTTVELKKAHADQMQEIINSVNVEKTYQNQSQQPSEVLENSLDVIQNDSELLPENIVVNAAETPILEETQIAPIVERVDTNESLETSSESTQSDSEIPQENPVVNAVETPILEETQIAPIVERVDTNESLETSSESTQSDSEIPQENTVVNAVETPETFSESTQSDSEIPQENTVVNAVETPVPEESQIPASSAILEINQLLDKLPDNVQNESKIAEQTPVLETAETTIEESRVGVAEEIKGRTVEEIPQENTVPTSLENFQAIANDITPVSNQESLGLAEKILALGDTGETKYIPQLSEYIYHPDSNIRQSVASAFGKITVKGITPETQKSIFILGKLSKDPEASVRQSAVAALGNIKSEKVIPLLQQALRDTDNNVVKTASAAFNQFKLYRVSKPKKTISTQSKLTKH